MDSLLAQTLTNWEALVIDDGSTDKSGKICDEYAKKDKRIIVFHKENGGPSEARNVGLERVKGEFVTFIDSDDYVESNFLEAQYTSLMEKNADVSICAFYGKKRKRGKVIKGTSATCLMFIGRLGGYVQLKFIRKSVIEGLKFNEETLFMEDVEFSYYLFKRVKKIAWSKTPLYHYRSNYLGLTGSKSGFGKHTKSIFKVLNEINRSEKNFFIKIAIKIEFCLLTYSVLYQALILGQVTDYQDEYYRSVRGYCRRHLLFYIFHFNRHIKSTIVLFTLLFYSDPNNLSFIRNTQKRRQELIKESERLKDIT